MLMESQDPLKTYRGNCHCGAFVYEAQLPEINSAAQCNCSICYKKGYLWLFPGPGDFQVVKGDEADLRVYTFGEGTTLHKVRLPMLWRAAQASALVNQHRGKM